MPEVKIVLADDHRLLREGLRKLLEDRFGYRVIGEAGDGEQALRLVSELEPQILVLDLALPLLPGLEVLRQLKASGGRTRSILLTAVIEPLAFREAFIQGARGVVLKDAATKLVFRCIETVMEGRYWLIGEALPDLNDVLKHEQVFRPDTRKENFGLTRREMQIVAAITAGKTNRELAAQFSISEQTVKHHVTHIYDKVGVSNRLELALFAIHHGLIRKSAELQVSR